MARSSATSERGRRVESSSQTPRFSPASLTCRRSAPSTLLSSSLQVGWTSLLLEHNRVSPESDVFEIAPTPDQTIVVQTRGEQHLASFRGGRWSHAYYRPGTSGITQPNTTARLRRRISVNAAVFEKVNLYIPHMMISQVCEHHRRAGQRVQDRPLTALAFEDPFIAGVVDALQRALAAGAPDIYAESTAQVLTTHLLSAHSPWLAISDDARDPGRISDRRLKRVLEYMRDHLSEPLTLDRLAAEAGISKFHFARCFSERTGVTPHAQLVRMRLDCAAHLLTGTDLRIGDISRRCGFASAAHFGATFARHFGKSPSAFRRP